MKDFDDQNWKKWHFQFQVALKNACPQVLHLVTKTLEATSLDGGDLEQMATELFDTLAMTVTDDALTMIQGITNFNGFEAWKRMVAR